ncbi:MAG: alpha/beta fold hydrolase [Pseudomonadales bacterium]
MNSTVAHVVRVAGDRPANLATDVQGSGQDFIWAHALLGSMAADAEGGVFGWQELHQDYRVIRYDARGHGQSDCHGDAIDFRWDALAGNLWDVVDSYTRDPVVLGGASMGCATALYAACERPSRVRGLVLVIPPTAWEARSAKKRNYENVARVARLSRGLPLKLLKFLPRSSAGKGFQKRSLSILAHHLTSANYIGIAGAMSGAALSDLPPPDILANLQIPALLLAWPGDDSHPLAVAERLANLLPNAHLQVAREPDEPFAWPRHVKRFMDELGN